MLRLAITLSIKDQDSQSTSYLLNGTHLGLHAPTQQSNHVQTSSRSRQMVVAIRNQDIGSPSAMVKHRQQVFAWNEFMNIVLRRPGIELNHLMVQYNLFPDWLLLIDESLMQAWLPDNLDLYLLRRGDLRRLKPVALTERPPAADQEGEATRVYYSMRIALSDQLFILPPAVLKLFEKGEAAKILTGLEQQPAKVRSLLHTAKLRGFSEEVSWLAVHVLNLEKDYMPAGSESNNQPSRLMRLLGHHGNQSPRHVHSESISLDGLDDLDQEDDQPKTLMGFLVRTRPFKYVVMAGVALIAGAIVLTQLLGVNAAPAETSGQTSTSQSTRAALSVTPTHTPTPTPILPQLIVSARQLNLRDAPSRDASLILTLANGDRLWQLEEPADEWVKVKTEDDLVGYVYYTYVKQVAITE